MTKAHVKGHVKEAEGKIKKAAGEHEAARADLKEDIKELAGA
jgi:uncharacterized protein YjbJ (UPF0337 family)